MAGVSFRTRPFFVYIDSAFMDYVWETDREQSMICSHAIPSRVLQNMHASIKVGTCLCHVS